MQYTLQGSDLVTELFPWRTRQRVLSLNPTKNNAKENRWDYNLPVSRVSQASLNQASIAFETNKRIFDNNTAQIKVNKVAMDDLSDQIIASEDASEIYELAQAKNNLAMENGNLEAQATVAEKEWKKALKVIHEHRGEIGEYYLDGPYTTEFRAFMIPAVALALGYAYFYDPRKRLKRGMNTLYKKSPLSGAFRYA